MNKTVLCLPAMLLFSAAAFAQSPAITAGGVVGGASFTPSGLPNSGIAQGSFFSIFGSNLGTSATAPSVPFPTTLGGATVNITSGGTTVQALLDVVTAGQINAILPSATPTGNATVTVTVNGSTSASVPITIVTANFAVFTQNASGAGPADVQDFTNNYALNTLRATSKPGNVGILYGTGLGPVANDAAGLTPPNPNLTVYVGGVQASVLYAGRSGFVGLDQINFTIPANAPTGCYVPLAIVTGSYVNASSSMSIDSGGATCQDPYGLTQSQIDTAATGKLSVASLLLTRLGAQISGLSTPISEDQGQGRFYQFDGSSAATSPEHLPSLIGISSFGSCAVSICANKSQCVPSSQNLALPHLDAGASLTVSGGGNTATLAKDSSGFYSALLGSYPLPLSGYPTTPVNFLQPATFTVTGPGGADISSFSASINVPGYLNWTSSQGTSSVNRSQDLTVNWTGGSSSDYVLVSVTSATNASTQPSGQYNAATVTCLQKASVGTFTIPSWMLEALPVSSTIAIVPGLSPLPSGALLAGIFNVSNTFTSSADVSLANSIVLKGLTLTVQ